MSWQEYYDWLNVGIEKGWISEPFCSTHDMGPWSDEEMKEWDDGYDPCFPAARLYGQERVLSDEDSVAHVDAGTFLKVIRGEGPEKHPIL